MMWECETHGGAEVSPTRPTHDCLLRANYGAANGDTVANTYVRGMRCAWVIPWTYARERDFPIDTQGDAR